MTVSWIQKLQIQYLLQNFSNQETIQIQFPNSRNYTDTIIYLINKLQIQFPNSTNYIHIQYSGSRNHRYSIPHQQPTDTVSRITIELQNTNQVHAGFGLAPPREQHIAHCSGDVPVESHCRGGQQSSSMESRPIL